MEEVKEQVIQEEKKDNGCGVLLILAIVFFLGIWVVAQIGVWTVIGWIVLFAILASILS